LLVYWQKLENIAEAIRVWSPQRYGGGQMARSRKKAVLDESVTLGDVERAAALIKGAVLDTDFDHSRTLSDLLGCEVWLKFENLQFTASFKERGALNRLAALSAVERRRGVIAMSAGNHAQGVAYHARRLGIPATIVMPEATPIVKVENTKGHGAEVILHGSTLEEAAEFAHRHGEERGLTFIHPYDDPVVIAGQGTIALEMLRAVPELDTLVVPIGGGGLISGMAVAAKAIKPDMRVIGVQAALYPSMYNCIKGTALPMRGDTLAEGIAVKAPGKITAELIRRHVDEIVLVEESELEHAVALLIAIEKTVVEGAGAAGLAAILAKPELFRGRKVGVVLCGGNIDTRLLASVLTRELAREGRLSEVSVDISDKPGQLARLAQVVGDGGANIVEVYHQRVFTDLPAKSASISFVIETRDRQHLHDVMAKIRAAGFNAKLHSNAAVGESRHRED
jgi:threonine dehydratase